MPRTIIVLGIVFALILARRLYRQWRKRVAGDQRPVPQIPAALVGSADRTWIVFTTPLCAACGPVTESLRAADPGSSVVTVDATEHVQLARQLRVRSAPTVFLADRSGHVQVRLVGAESVSRHLVGAQASNRP